MIPTSFAHVALNCLDMPRMEQFYRDYFGFRRARVVALGDRQIVFLKAGDVYLELFQAEGPAPTPAAEHDGPTWQGVRHLAFRVADVDATLAELGPELRLSFGPFNFDSFIPGWRTAWVTDPEGNVVEVTQGFTDDPHPPELAAELQAASTAG